MSRAVNLLFAVLCYAIFFATFLYLIAFVGGLAIVPKTVDGPVSAMTTGAAVVIDLALIALFGVQHSVMARPGFKRAWTKVVPRQSERVFNFDWFQWANDYASSNACSREGVDHGPRIPNRPCTQAQHVISSDQAERCLK